MVVRKMVPICISFGFLLLVVDALKPTIPTASATDREINILKSSSEYNKSDKTVQDINALNASQEFDNDLLNKLILSQLPNGNQTRPKPKQRSGPSPKSDWMSKVPNDQLLSHMTIPGTHESCSRYGTWIAECQEKTLTEQLEQGIRFLDIRCRVYNDIFTIHHGIVYQNIVFGQVLNECLEFLNQHPTETILMRVKQEYSEASDAEFRKIFDVYRKEKGYKNEPFGDRMYVEYRVPTLGEVRGKIVIVSNVWGLPGIQWDDIDKQDDYSVPTLFHLGGKFGVVKDHLEKAAKKHHEGNRNVFLNFATGSGGLFPFTVAKYVNKGLYSFLDSAVHDYMGPNDKAYYGIVALDFPGKYDDGVVDQLIERNKKVNKG